MARPRKSTKKATAKNAFPKRKKKAPAKSAQAKADKRVNDTAKADADKRVNDTAKADKKKAAKPKGGKQLDETLLQEAREVLPRLQAGETTMGAERDRLGFSSNRPLREALFVVLGSKEAYFALLEQRLGPQRAAGIPQVSDADVPVNTSSRCTEGWSGATMDVHGQSHDVVIDPEGVEYVRAQANERADLIVDHTVRFPDLGRSRWRRRETSAKERAARKEARVQAQGERARVVAQNNSDGHVTEHTAAAPRQEKKVTRRKATPTADKRRKKKSTRRKK